MPVSELKRLSVENEKDRHDPSDRHSKIATGAAPILLPLRSGMHPFLHFNELRANANKNKNTGRESRGEIPSETTLFSTSGQLLMLLR